MLPLIKGFDESKSCIFVLSVSEPVHACEFCLCMSMESSSPCCSRPQRSVSTCLDSMWSPGPAYRSQTLLLLLFTTLAVEWKTAGSHAALSANTLSHLVNMFCKGNSLGKHCDRAKHKSSHIFVSLISWCDS